MNLGQARSFLSKDLTLLGWPGEEFWWAHFNYQLCYGEEGYRERRAWAEERHTEWVKQGREISIQKNWQGHEYVEAKK